MRACKTFQTPFKFLPPGYTYLLRRPPLSKNIYFSTTTSNSSGDPLRLFEDITDSSDDDAAAFTDNTELSLLSNDEKMRIMGQYMEKLQKLGNELIKWINWLIKVRLILQEADAEAKQTIELVVQAMNQFDVQLKARVKDQKATLEWISLTCMSSHVTFDFHKSYSRLKTIVFSPIWKHGPY
ncbi:unnamed protein product [Ambrosiozyma monospora]|uniref:Unnamed protein product n=1 Tax=Ambrosiozyma monospora TaxID=43982 RepID=A0ACB5UCF6_AMBMO|nr:unnamed protein product [Ambrosiozyma monospora]